MGLSDYTKLSEIGKGSFGVVILTRCNKDKKKYVVKRIDLKNATKRERQNAMQEAKLLSTLDHPNIVAHRESFLSANCLYIVMQYCEGGDLYHRIRKQYKKRRYFSEKHVMDWFVQIALAIQYLHSNNIMHRDLKTQNIFLSKKDVIKVGDLGIARVLDSDQDMATTLTGTPYYMSPELFNKVPYNKKSDVWSLGCCMFEVATLKKAFNAKDYDSLAMKVTRGNVGRLPRAFPDEMNDLFHSMLAVEPDERPSVDEMLQQYYVQGHLNRLMEAFTSRKTRGSATSSRSESASSPKATSSKRISQSSGTGVSLSPAQPSSPSSTQDTHAMETASTAQQGKLSTNEARRMRREKKRSLRPVQSTSASSTGTPRASTSSTPGALAGRVQRQATGHSPRTASAPQNVANTRGTGDDDDDDDDDDWEISSVDEDEDEREEDGHGRRDSSSRSGHEAEKSPRKEKGQDLVSYQIGFSADDILESDGDNPLSEDDFEDSDVEE